MNGERQPGGLVASAAAACADGSARPAGPADAVDGVIPGAVVEPTSSEALGTTLAWALREKLTVVVRGGGRIDWVRRASRLDLLLSTRRMQKLVAHRHADPTVTVEAGARLAAREPRARAAPVSGFRSIRRSAIAPPLAESWPPTIGGPRRRRYGAPAI